MQIKLATARGLGYTGTAEGLRDPNTNLTYAVRYLAGAYRAANGDHRRAMAYYAGGYYYAAKRLRHARYEQPATAGEIAELVHRPVPVIPYAVGFATAPADIPPRPGRVADDPFVVLFVGNLIERKGVRYLVDAVHRLSPRIPMRLLILGKGEGAEGSRLREQVKSLGLEDRVEMPGRVPEPELHRAFARANVLVLPSIVDARGDTEGLGVVLLEAMSYHLPVIASNVGGITDIVADGETGLLVPPADPVALAAALERLATDAPLAERLADAGRRYVQEHFSWPAILEEWEACYAAALEAARRRRPVSSGADAAVSG